MITGETEALIENHLYANEYDDFFGSKKKRTERKAKRKARRLARRIKRNSSAKVQQRKQKRSKFFNDVGQVYQDIGGATAIGGVIDAIVMPKDRQAQSAISEVPSDYQFSVGQSDNAIEEENEKEQKKGIPTIVYVIGGVVVVGIIGLLIVQNNRRSPVQTFSQ